MKKLRIAKTLLILSLGFFISQLTACHKVGVPAYIYNPTTQNLPYPQVARLHYIEKSGIQVIKQGMQFTFVIPIDCFFTRDKRQLKRHREKDMDVLAQFIREYMSYFQHPRVRVYGYSDKVWFAPARDKISLHYARSVAGFLVEDGIDPEYINVKGEGAKHPIASNGYPMGTAFNRRVEVMVYSG